MQLDKSSFTYKQICKFESRFIKGAKDECWNWLRGKDNDGYGIVDMGGNKRTHRVSYALYKGVVPKGIQVLHKCDNPSCVNPNHLFLGTANDNVQDMIKKGRSNFGVGLKDIDPGKGTCKNPGSLNGHAILTETKVLEIRRLHATGKYFFQDLSNMFGTIPYNIGSIIRRKRWKHV